MGNINQDPRKQPKGVDYRDKNQIANLSYLAPSDISAAYEQGRRDGRLESQGVIARAESTNAALQMAVDRLRETIRELSLTALGHEMIQINGGTEAVNG